MPPHVSQTSAMSYKAIPVMITLQIVYTFQKTEFLKMVEGAAREAWKKSKNGKPLDTCLFEALAKKGFFVP